MKLHFLENFFKKNNVDGILLLSDDNRYWFTNFLSSAGYLFINKKLESILLIDGRYYENAKKQLEPNIKVELLKPSNASPLKEQISTILAKLNINSLMLESEYVNIKDYDYFKNNFPNLLISSFDSLSLRIIKDDKELEYLQHAADIAADTIEWIKTKLKPGLTEKEVARMITIHMLELGAEKNSFDPIVASGINSSNPHHKPSEKIIEYGDMVTVDIGCIYKGYCSDITRSFILGDKPNNIEMIDIYNIVLKAQLSGIENTTINITGEQLDSVCRNIISNSKYKDYFCHGTGHGVGIQVHEEPYISPNSKTILMNNNVITIEPGIYVPNVGGVRIEDTIVVKENGQPIVLTRKANKELYVK